jgi:hypothetical protein
MPEGGRAPCNITIAQGQQGRLCFAFLFEEDEEKAQEGRRRGKLNATFSH